MSYDIYIGNLVMSDLDDEDPGVVYLTVDRVELPDAPEFPNDAMTGKSNSRHPAYSGWSQFLRDAALPESFYVEDHPGARRISDADLKLIDGALARWRAMHPNTKPGFDGGKMHWVDTEVAAPGTYDPVLARLIWLRFWTAWALAKCENPGVYNH